MGRIWASADDEVRTVGRVNALLSDTRAAPWLTWHPEMPEWHLHLASIHDPLAQRMGPRWRCRWPTWSASANCAG